MTGSDDRLHDVRRRPTFEIEKAALEYLPQVGPAAWSVYCYLISLATDGDNRWPQLLTIASACGISTYNAHKSIEELLDSGLIVRHQWTSTPGGRVSFAIVPMGESGETDEQITASHDQPQGTDRLVAEDAADEEVWRAEARERNQARELFTRLIESLDVEPGELSEQARSTAADASRLARAAGATPDEVTEIMERLRDARPDMLDDAERMLEYWSQLFDEMSEEPNGDPDL